MRSVFVLFALAVLVPTAAAQSSRTKSTIDFLVHSYPEITWSQRSATAADVTCDGKLDSIVLGLEKTTVVVAVVSGKAPDRVQLLRFPIGTQTQDGFCATPTKVEVYPLECDSDLGPLPGCKPATGCKDFSVLDDDCDRFNFYWDSSRKLIAWWRH